jgi:hypothetical protein
MLIDLLLSVVGTEAMVFYIFTASPLQPARAWIIAHTPVLVIGGDHLLECKICISFWIGVIVGTLYFTHLTWILLPLALARASNWLHLVFSLIADRQMDLRINRNRNNKEK